MEASRGWNTMNIWTELSCVVTYIVVSLLVEADFYRRDRMTIGAYKSSKTPSDIP